MRQQIVWSWNKNLWRTNSASKSGFSFFFLGDIFWLFPAVMLQQVGVCSDTKTDAGQLEQN